MLRKVKGVKEMEELKSIETSLHNINNELDKMEARHNKDLDRNMRYAEQVMDIANKAIILATKNSEAIEQTNKSFDRVYKLTLAILGVTAFGILGYFTTIIFKLGG